MSIKSFFKYLCLIFIFILSITQTYSYDLDMSVDSEIKNQYNSNKLEQDVLKGKTYKNDSKTQSNSSVPRTPLSYSVDKPTITQVDKNTSLKIPQWTHFKVKSNQQITDYSRVGSTITFTTVENVYKKSVTIPSGTKIYGEIVNSHRPQRTGNGGLVVIKITSMSYKGNNYQLNGKVTKANSKKIFLNNIKGKRQYIAGVGKQIDKGERFYKKTRNTSSKMADNPILVILSPIPTVVGVVGYSVNAVASPLIALKTKGGNLSIPAGSSFEIKLLDSAYVR